MQLIQLIYITNGKTMCALFSYTLLKNACELMLSYHNECMFSETV